MKRLKELINKYPLHPFLISLFPALFLYSHNLTEYHVSVIFFPLLISFLFAILSFLSIALIFRNFGKAAIFSSLFLVLFFSFGRLREPIIMLKLTVGNFSLGSGILLMIAVMIILALAFFILLRTRRQIARLNKALNIISAVLIAFPLLGIVPYELNEIRSAPSAPESPEETLPADQLDSEKPDIYYLIFDRYAGEKALQLYNYDNREFLNFLTEKGFYVASESASNYPATHLSLASSLNMDYLNEEPDKPINLDKKFFNSWIKDNKVIELLKSMNYQYIHLGSWWEKTRENHNADINFKATSVYLDLDEFTTQFMWTTLVAPVLGRVFPEWVATDPRNGHRLINLSQFKNLSEVPNLPGPKFVFAHFLLPHEPWVFEKNCEAVAEEEVDQKAALENYLNQLSCATIKIKEVVTQILNKSNKPPVIIIQADEGPYPKKFPVENRNDWEKASVESLQEKFPILNAYYLPGKDQGLLYPGITPVNTFRLIFNLYSQTDLPLLPDKNYSFKSIENKYQFFDVTEKLK